MDHTMDLLKEDNRAKSLLHIFEQHGDLDDEDEVLTWLTDEDTLEIPGRIEEVNTKMLEKILAENQNVVVFFYKENDKKSQKIIQELENIDDECEEKEIDFVKTSDEGVEKEYDLPSLPSLAFYRNKLRKLYPGDLMHEEAILDWVLELSESSPDVIESVDRKTLQMLIDDVEHLAVFFYDDKCESCEQILEELETIDDDTDKHGIQFVKSKDSKLASEIGIFSFPALVYYETGVPIMYDGDGCFIIGLGGKSEVPEPSSYEPYKCCPTKVNRSTKVAKVTPAKPRSDESKAKSKDKDKSAVSTEKSSKGKRGLGKYIWWW